jgi:hypothetical protein
VGEANGKPRKGKRAENQALKLECPQCGAKVGELCVNYAGVKCAPHAARHVVPPERPARPAPVKLEQQWLFRPTADARQEGGM